MTAGPIESWGRALAAAAVLGDAGAALTRIGGAAGEEARRLSGEWKRMAREVRAREVARVVAAVRAPVPAGGERVDRGWSEAALDDDRGRAAWEGRRGDAVGVWWRRRVAAAWVELPGEDEAAAVAAGELVRWPAARIVGAMRQVTLALVAHVALEGGDAAVARVAAAIVDGKAVVALARRLRAEPGVRAGLGPVRAAAPYVAAIDVGIEVGLGAAVIARHLPGDAGVAVRLLVPPAIAGAMDGDAPAVAWETVRTLIGR